MKVEQAARPVLRYPGGKWRLAPWVISHFPAHDVYVEPFCGGASVLLRKPRARHGEVINDLDGDVVNLFRVLRDKTLAMELKGGMELTPFAREEFISALSPSDDPVERARRFLIRAFMGQGSCVLYEKNGFRSNRTGAQSPAMDWANLHKFVFAVVKRLQGVVIENLPALEVIQKYDRERTLFYIDPPYVHSTRTDRGRKAYRHEMTDEDHKKLAEQAHCIKGKVIISGYSCDLYDALYKGWARVEKEARADGGARRTECLWLSPNALVNGLLFEE